MNVADSEEMAMHLMSCGHTETGDMKSADIILVNTCSVREHPENSALSFLGRIKPLKRKNPELKVIFAGCVAQRLKDVIKKRFPAVDLVIGAKDIGKFPEIIGRELANWRIGELASSKALPIRQSSSSPIHDVSSFVTITRGCENFCSYCIVPYVRGREFSLPASGIVNEIKILAGKGVKEVTLLGQNVNSYIDGSGLAVRSSEKRQSSKALDFADLLSEVNKIEGIERIRFISSHPKDFSDKLIDAVAGLQKVCEHVHLPIQSGSDRILAAMNRKYGVAKYMSIVEKLRNKVKDISITSDILVGFPGETEADFKNTLDAVKQAGFDSLFAFKYSPRPGTLAASLKDNVPLETKESRLQRVLHAANTVAMNTNAKLAGTLQEVLIDAREDDGHSGRTRTNKKVFLKNARLSLGSTVTARIVGTKISTLIGETAEGLCGI
ncbi:MAG: tRNA (N6-isopentenyl adenosine(37)-C2)-methylthiotransferase MiaB [Endomicrobiales bacterium]|nr:tRNA (N6-isopentenyl adenosine(37)-C2)-methylthiotransferase MiaB [Endomicrobiales bacterium]